MERECIFCGTLLDEECKSKYICNDCDRKMSILKQVNKVDKATERISRERARYIHERQKYTYENERFSVVNKIINSGFKFNSTEEICVALQCEKEKIQYFPNYKIGNYTVDFLFPELKIIFEVDGEMYHSDPDKDFIRERGIMYNVGEDYEIVRLGTTYIPRFILLNLKEALEHVVFQRNSYGQFRDTRNDWKYFQEYINLAGYMRRNR